MQTLFGILLVGMIWIVVFMGNGGFIHNLILGTSTSDTAYKAILPIAFCLGLLVILIMRIGRSRKHLGGG